MVKILPRTCETPPYRPFSSVSYSSSNYPLTPPATAAGSNTYILRSTLDTTEIIEQAALSHERRLLVEELTDGVHDNDDYDDMPHNYGTVIAWSAAAALGLPHVIPALEKVILIERRIRVRFIVTIMRSSSLACTQTMQICYRAQFDVARCSTRVW